MANLSKVARQARIVAYKGGLAQVLAHRIIDTKKATFSDLIADNNPNKLMDSLNGEIILDRDFFEDGSLRGILSISLNDLAAILPDLKADTQNRMGWKKYLDMFAAEGKNILASVASPQPSEYEVITE